MIWLPIAFTVLGIIYIIWAINAYITMHKIDRTISAVLKLKMYTKSWEIFYYHSPLHYKSWFGFRHWFYRYDPFDDYSNLNDFI